jgi:alkylation response protein AidB-like acyl-CoA dehydrogenase
MPLTAEQLEIRTLAREFAGDALRPRSGEWDAAGEIDGAVFDQLAELGFMGMRVPEAYGGLELDTPTYLTALEAISWGDASVALAVGIHGGPISEVLMRHGSEEQKERWLPRVAAGEFLAAFALTEPEAGSDAASLQATAVREGEEWVLKGTKTWITNGDRAGAILVFARTTERGIGAFWVPRDTPGYSIVENKTTMGFTGSETVTARLEDVRIPADHLIGDPERGFSYALESLGIGRLGVGALAVGIGQAAMEHAVRYAGERKQFGRPIGEFGAIQEKIANMAARLASARALILESGARMDGAGVDDGGPTLATRCALAKLVATEAAVWVADEAVQIFGGYGYMREYPVEKLLRDAKGTEIFEGTSEILRLITAREYLAD